MAMEQVQAPEDPISIFEELDAYDWDNDSEFQVGLRAILTNAPPDQVPRLAIRARCYYFARKYRKSVDFEGYLHWTHVRNELSAGGANEPAPVEAPITTTFPQSTIDPVAQPAVSQASDPMGNAPPPASFAEICELIAAGKPIPGIKDIPDTVLEGQATLSQASRRKKPWEKDATPVSPPAWARAG